MSAVLNQVKTISLNRVITHLRTPMYLNAYALMVSTAATSALGIVYWALAARYYSAEVVGMNAAAMSMIFFLSGLAQLNIKSAMIRFLQTAGRSTRRLIVLGYLIVLTLSALAGFVFLQGIARWAPALGIFNSSLALGASFILGVMAWSIFSLQDNVLTGLRQAIWVPVENIIFAALKILLLVWLASAFHELGVFASWMIPVALAVLPVNWLIFRYLVPRHVAGSEHRAEPIHLVPLIRYVGGDYIGSLFALAAATLLPLLVLNQAGSAANAYFYLAWVIGGSLLLLNVNLMASFTVEASAEPNKLDELATRALVHGLKLTRAAGSGGPGTRTIYPFVFGRAYAEEGVTLLRLLALVPIAHLFNALFIAIARVRRNVRQMVAIQMAQCILGLGLAYILIGMYGITGVGIALLLAEGSIALVLGLVRGKRVLRPMLCQLLSRRS